MSSRGIVADVTAEVPVPTLDRATFETWYRAAFPQVFAYAMKLTGGDRRLAENVTQETFLQAVRRMQRDPDEALGIGWLITVVRTRVIDEARRSERLDRKVTRLATFTGRGDDSSSDPSALQSPHEILAVLPPLERVALALRYVDDLPVAEVARSIDKTVTATESLLARGRRRLRGHLQENRDV